ncbi:hypothetical protein CANTEDRAFT_137005 [Yamadazyma tenuis ATCC 10573]|uniref:Uncharacterized protein n=2 Tax=Candida tenuis TaxID=2315449 RepID=G3BEE3_CANTC|nr:uncharacterized protein CANTEDRAFT_137005 [Yamadazyma tenuis ATCC 10573]EGV60526.1 hypothetical protein CANTEDRAFT_137005 [Yamadazyma tenuis ATCC 10573]
MEPTTKKLDKVDPLSVAESLGIRTYRKVSRNTWTPDDDAELIGTLKQISAVDLGEIDADTIDWDLLASKLTHQHRKPKDYKKRWVTSLDPNVRKGRWTKEEDDQLIEAYARFGPSWQKVASHIRTRTMDQCAKRYTEVLDPKTKDRLNPWSREEEMLLIKQIGIHGTKWRSIASNFKNRPALTCRNKWRTIALGVARGRAHPHIAAEVEKITSRKEVLDATADVSPASTSPASTGAQPLVPPSQSQLRHTSAEWRYTLTPSESTPASFMPPAKDMGVIKDEATVRLLLDYANSYGLKLDIHQHTHHHYAPPPHPFNHIAASPPDFANIGASPGLGPVQPSNRSIFLEPEAQLHRFQHFNYLPPLTEVPKLTSSSSPVMTASERNGRDIRQAQSPSGLTPLTQAAELAVGEVVRKRKNNDYGLDSTGSKKLKSEGDGGFFEQIRHLTDISQSSRGEPKSNGGTDGEGNISGQRPVSQHHPLHYFTGGTTPQANIPTPAAPRPTNRDEDEEEDEEMRSYGLFYQSYRKSRSNSHFEPGVPVPSTANPTANSAARTSNPATRAPATSAEAPPTASQEKHSPGSSNHENDHDHDGYNFVYENLLGSFGMMPFNPS